MSLTGAGQNININEANFVFTDNTKKLRVPRVEFWDGTNTSTMTYSSLKVGVANLAVTDTLTFSDNTVVNSANNFDLANVTSYGSTTGQMITLSNAVTSLVTAGKVGIANTNPSAGYDLSIGSDLLVQVSGSNTLTVKNNVVASHFIGDGSLLTGIASTLDDIVNNGNTTSSVVSFTNPATSLTTSGNVIVAKNVEAAYFIGDGSQLTNISSTLDDILTNGAESGEQVTLTNATKALQTTANIQVGQDLLLANAAANTIVATNNVAASHYHGNAKYLTDTTDATQGTYGGARKAAVVEVSSDGRIASVSETDIASNVSAAVAGQVAYYTDAHTIGGDSKLIFNDGDAALTVGGNLRVSGDLYVTGNTISTNNFTLNDTIFEIGNAAANNTTLGFIMQRPAGNVAMGFLSDELGNAYTNTLVLGFTNNGAGSPNIVPDTSTDLPVRIFGNLTTTSDLIVGAPSQFIVDEANSRVGISNAAPGHDLSIGATFLVDKDGANTVVATNNVAASHYHGNAVHLVSTTDAAAGSYGTAVKVPQITVSSDGRITSISNVDVTETLDSVMARGDTTATEMKLTNTDVALTTTGNVQIGDKITLSNAGANSIVASANISAPYFVGDGSLLTDVGTTSNLQTVLENGNAANIPIVFDSDIVLSGGLNDRVKIGHEAGNEAPGAGGQAVAIGLRAGRSGQEGSTIAVGAYAGERDQSGSAVAIGISAGQSTQGPGGIAIGADAAFRSQKDGAVAVGRRAGTYSQGSYAVAIGFEAGHTSQHDNTIIINATGSDLDSTVANALYIDPIRSQNGATGNVLIHTGTKEVVTSILQQDASGVKIASTLSLNKSDANTVVATNNVAASYYHGNAVYLTSTTDATAGSYGTAVKVPQITVSSDGRITSISNVDVTETLDSVMARGDTTATEMKLTNATLGVTTTGNVQVGTAVTLANASANAIVATANISAPYFIGDGSLLTGLAATLDEIAENGATTDVKITLENATTALETTANIQVGQDLLLANAAANTIVATNNVAASHYFGNAKYLTKTTDATAGSYGTAVKVPQITVSADGRITSISNVDVTETLDTVMARGDTTATEMKLTNADVGVTTTGNVQVGTAVTLANASANAIVATANISAPYFIGDGSLLTGLAATLDEIAENGATTDVKITLENATTALETTANIKVGQDLLLANAAANTIVATNNVAASHYFGNAKYLTKTTDATAGSYGTTNKVPQISVSADGRITSISNVDVTESLDTVMARGATTATEMKLTNATKGLTTRGNVQVGTAVTISNTSANSIVATRNVAASHFIGNGSLLTNVPTTSGLNVVLTNGASSDVQMTLSNAAKGLQTTANIQVGQDLLLANAAANTIVATNNVAASHYFGNAKYLTKTTDATAGSYGTAVKVPQISVSADGRITSISNVDVTETLDSVMARGDTTATEMKLTNANVGLTTRGNVQVGTAVTISNASANSIVATRNVVASHFIGNGSLLTNVPTASGLDVVLTNGASSGVQMTLTNAAKGLQTTANIQVGQDLLLANAAANTIVATNNVAASHYYGNAKYLTRTTDAGQGTYGGARKAAVVEVSSDGRIASVSETDIASNVSTAVAGQVAYYTDAHTIGGDANLVFNDGDSALTVGGNLRVSGDLYVTGNTISVDNFTLNDTIFEIGNTAADNTTLGFIMQRPSGNVAMGFLSDEMGNAYTNTLVLGFTNSGAASPNIIPDASTDLPVRIFGNLTTTSDIIVGSPAQFIIDEANSRVGIANAAPGHDLSIGTTFLVDKDGANTVVATNNVAASYYYGNASQLVSTTDAAAGSYGTAVKVPQITVSSDGRITSISNVDVTETLDSVMARGDTTATEMKLTNADVGVTTTGNVQVGTAVTLANASANAIVATANISAPYFIGDGSLLTGLAATLDEIAENGATTDVKITLENATTGLETTANIQVGQDLLLANAAANTIVATNNVSASYYHGNAVHLVSTTDAAAGSYGTAVKVPQITVSSDGRITSISNVDVTETLDSVMARGDTTATEMKLTNADVGVTTTGNVQVGTAVTLSNASANAIVATANISAPYFIGDGSLLTGLAATLDEIAENGSTTDVKITLENATTALETTANIQVGQDLLLANAAANTIVATNNVSASYYHGNAAHLVSTTDVAQGSYGTAVKVPQITVSSDGRITSISNVDVTETLNSVMLRGNTTSAAMTLTHAAKGLQTTANIKVGQDLLLANAAANTIVATNNVAASHYFGNAKYLTRTTDVTQGSYGTTNKVPQITVSADGRITSISNVDVSETLDTVMARGDTTATEMKLTNTDVSVTTTGNVQVGTAVTISNASANSIVATTNVVASHFKGIGKYLTQTTDVAQGSYGTAVKIPQITVSADGRISAISNVDLTEDLASVTARGATTSEQISLTNTGTSLVTSGKVGIANTSPGHDLSIGSNLFVDDTGSNVLVVYGNATCTTLTSDNVNCNQITFSGGSAQPVQTLTLQDVCETGNTFDANITALYYKMNGGLLLNTANTVSISDKSVISQGSWAIAIGATAGYTSQGQQGIAIGLQAGTTEQEAQSIAIGVAAGASYQGSRAVAIGLGAGGSNQGSHSIAIGMYAGNTSQGSNSIILNATGSDLSSAVAETFFVDPIRDDVTGTANVLVHNSVTKEVTRGVIQQSSSGVDIGATLSVDEIVIGSATRTPTLASSTLTMDTSGKSITVHHYDTTADISTLTVNNMNDGDTATLSITNTDSSSHSFSPGGSIKTNFTTPVVIPASDTVVASIMKLNGSIFVSASIFS